MSLGGHVPPAAACVVVVWLLDAPADAALVEDPAAAFVGVVESILVQKFAVRRFSVFILLCLCSLPFCFLLFAFCFVVFSVL